MKGGRRGGTQGAIVSVTWSYISRLGCDKHGRLKREVDEVEWRKK